MCSCRIGRDRAGKTEICARHGVSGHIRSTMRSICGRRRPLTIFKGNQAMMDAADASSPIDAVCGPSAAQAPSMNSATWRAAGKLCPRYSNDPASYREPLRGYIR